MDNSLEAFNANYDHCMLCYREGRHEEALQAASQAFRIFYSNPDRRMNFPENRLLTIGDIAFNSRVWNVAIECYKRVGEGSSAYKYVAKAKYYLALSKTGDINKAIQGLKNLAEITEINSGTRSGIHKNLGDIYNDLGLNSHASGCYSKAVDLLRPITEKNEYGYLELMNNYAESLVESGEFGRAAEIFKQSLDYYTINRNTGVSGVRSMLFHNYAGLSELQGDFEKAFSLLEKAGLELKIHSQEFEKEIISLKAAHARLAIHQSFIKSNGIDPEEANLQFILKLDNLHIIDHGLFDVLLLKSRFQELLNDTEGALQTLRSFSGYERYLTPDERINTRLLTINLLRKSGSLEDAARNLDETADEIFSSEDSPFRLFCMIRLAATYLGMGSVNRCKKTIEPIDLSILSRSGFYKSADYYYVDRNLRDLENILANLVRLEFRETPIQMGFYEFKGSWISLIVKSFMVRNLLETYTARHKRQYINSVEHDGNNGRATRVNGEFEELVSNGLDSLFSSISKDGALFLMIRSEDMSLEKREEPFYSAILFTQNQIWFNANVVTEANLRDCNFFQRVVLNDSSDPSWIAENIHYWLPYELKRIYDMLFGSVKDLMVGINKMTFIGEGLAQYIPFHALMDKSGTYLMDRFREGIIRLDGFYELFTEYRAITIEKLFLVGGIDYGSIDGIQSGQSDYGEEGINRVAMGQPEIIREANKELNDIEICYGNKSVETTRIETDVDISTFKDLSTEINSVVHILTHGFFYPKEDRIYQFAGIDDYKPGDTETHLNPLLRSGLFLSGYNRFRHNPELINRDSKGVITAYDISLMDFKGTQLVSIHACQSGLGAIRKNSSYGINRAFKNSGVKFTITTLWSIYYSEFFIMLYEMIAEQDQAQPLDIREIFHKCLHHYREKYKNDPLKSSPFFWGGIVLNG